MSLAEVCDEEMLIQKIIAKGQAYFPNTVYRSKFA
jgi:hypothetical protein